MQHGLYQHDLLTQFLFSYDYSEEYPGYDLADTATNNNGVDYSQLSQFVPELVTQPSQLKVLSNKNSLGVG